MISQPIKGTAKRLIDKMEDEKLRLQLENDQKERSENIMITDLVRNDLSKFANKGSVKVDELCKIYSFEQVHQMISTITSYRRNHLMYLFKTIYLTKLINFNRTFISKF